MPRRRSVVLFAALPVTMTAMACGSFGDAAEATCDNGALRFAGGQHVDVADAPELEGAGPMTVEAWVLASGEAGKQQQGDIVSHASHSASSGKGWALYVRREPDGSTVPHFRFYRPEPATLVGNPKPAERWMHLAAVVEQGGRARLYVDGVRDAEGSGFDGAIDYEGPLRIGGSAENSGFRLLGAIAEVRVTRAVVYPDVTFERPRTPLGVSAETVALWSFDEPSGIELGDATGRHTAVMPAPVGQQPERVRVPCFAAMP